MPPPENDRGRLLAETASNVDCDGDSTSLVAQCRICGHPLSAPRSVQLGIGPVCRRRDHRKGRTSTIVDVHCCTSMTLEERMHAAALGLWCSERLCARQALAEAVMDGPRLSLVEGGAA